MAKSDKLAVSFTTKAMRWCSALAGCYVILVFVLPINTTVLHNYHLSHAEYHTLLLLVVLPLFAVWLAAFYGYASLLEYSQSLTKTKEGAAFQKLTQGCRWLAWGLPLSSLLGLVMNGIASRYTPFYGASIIIINYLNVIIALFAFNHISHGSRGLIERAKLRFSVADVRGIILTFMVLGVAYCFLTFRHLNLQGLNSTANPYHLPGWLMILTITVPYLYIWFIGLLAIYEITLYGKHIHGVLYRQPMQLVAGGLMAVIISSAGVQYINSAIPRTGHLRLNLTLVVVYAVYALTATGYLLISSGARRLKRIEEV